MRLTQWTDYSLRALDVPAGEGGAAALFTITEAKPRTHQPQRSHLMKIVQQLEAVPSGSCWRPRAGGQWWLHAIRWCLPVHPLIPQMGAPPRFVTLKVRATWRERLIPPQPVPPLRAAATADRLRGAGQADGLSGGAWDGVTLADLVAPALDRRGGACRATVAAPRADAVPAC